MHVSNYAASNRSGASKYKKHLLKVDMTPMVDLGFLLITFFILTAEMSRPAITDFYMPKDGLPTLLSDKDAITVILQDNNKIIAYSGDFQQAKSKEQVLVASLSDIRNIIKTIRTQNNNYSQLMLLIKPTNDAMYGDVINMLDEVLINDIKKYALVDLSDEEQQYLDRIYSGN